MQAEWSTKSVHWRQASWPDLVVLSHDITAIPPSELLGVQVQRVMLNGLWQTT